MMFLLTCLLPSSFSPPRAALMPEMVQPILDRMAAKWNMSFQLGFVDAEGTVALAAGKDDIWDPHGPTPLTNTTRIPLGSVTKPWTALRVMQHVEAGTIQLDDPAHTWIDPVLARLSPQGPPSMERMSMARLWLGTSRSERDGTNAARDDVGFPRLCALLPSRSRLHVLHQRVCVRSSSDPLNVRSLTCAA